MIARVAGTALDGIVALRVTDRVEAARWVSANLLAAAHIQRRHSALSLSQRVVSAVAARLVRASST